MANRAFSCVLAGALILAFAPTALGQGGVAIGPGGVDTQFKTPPLQESDTILIPLDMHPTTAMGAPWLGWGGAMMRLHLADPTEVDVLAVADPSGNVTTLPFGPPSQGVASSSRSFTFFHPGVFGSGIPLTPSVNQPIFTLSLHAKNTLPINNSDFDLTASFANIWHVIGGSQFASQIVVLDPSAYVFVTSAITKTALLHTVNSQIEWNPAQPGTVPPDRWAGEQHLRDLRQHGQDRHRARARADQRRAARPGPRGAGPEPALRRAPPQARLTSAATSGSSEPRLPAGLACSWASAVETVNASIG
jgi:hypothetical protein